MTLLAFLFGVAVGMALCAPSVLRARQIIARFEERLAAAGIERFDRTAYQREYMRKRRAKKT